MEGLHEFRHEDVVRAGKPVFRTLDRFELTVPASQPEPPKTPVREPVLN